MKIIASYSKEIDLDQLKKELADKLIDEERLELSARDVDIINYHLSNIFLK